jgi:hypothetical protein
MEKNKMKITIDSVRDGFNTIFPKAVKSLEIEEDEEEGTFVFELEFVGEVNDLLIPDGIFIAYIDFEGKFVEGFIDGASFLEFVQENK